MNYNFYEPRLSDLDAEECRLIERFGHFNSILDGAMLAIDKSDASPSNFAVTMQNLQIASAANKLVMLTRWQLNCLEGLRGGIYNVSQFPHSILL